MSTGEFSVCQFFADGSYEYVRRYVNAEEAKEAAITYCSNVAMKVGITNRVIITDGGDMICFEYKRGEGIVFPSEEKERARQ
jgi:hypothetical protein